MAVIELVTLICGRVAGTLYQDEQGLAHFAYVEGYDGPPLSLSMPISNRTYHQRVVRPYLFGLLPDSDRQRKAIAEEFEVRPNNPVTMLAHIGLDCPGGVQFCAPDRLDDVLTRTGSYRPLSDHEIARHLKVIREDRDATWMGTDENWSLGGNQGKFALGFHNERWCSCEGAAPTTHIVKNGVIGFKLQALNEYVCMKVAERCGVATAHVDYRMFEDEPALIVERYDRIRQEDGTVARLHQEDLCQALSVMPSEKYTADGGPTAKDIVQLLADTQRAHFNLVSFTHMLLFNYLIGATDAHAKNYSVLLGNGSRNAFLARMYDVASGLAYSRLRRHGRLAMPIGGENRFGRVSGQALERYVRNAGELAQERGLTVKACRTLMADLAQEIPPSMAEVFDESADIPGAAELREHLEPHVVANCERALAML